MKIDDSITKNTTCPTTEGLKSDLKAQQMQSTYDFMFFCFLLHVRSQHMNDEVEAARSAARDRSLCYFCYPLLAFSYIK